LDRGEVPEGATLQQKTEEGASIEAADAATQSKA
jgi:hypothetical protein